MRLFFTSMLTVLSLAVLAQSNYQQGYVIKNNGDTLNGFINHREWAECPTSIDFKLNKADSRVMRFEPRTIKRFTINTMETYVTFAGAISMGRTKFPDIPNGLDTLRKQDTVFLKELVTGRHLTLFFQQDNVKTRFFIAEGDGQPVELQYFQYFDFEKTVEKNTYKGQLLIYINEFMPSDDKLKGKVENVRYNQGDLEKIVSEINGDLIPVNRKSMFRLFAGIGLYSTKTELDDNTQNIEKPVTESTITNYVIMPEQITRFSSTVSPKIGFGVDMFTNPEVQRFIFRTELAFSYITVIFIMRYIISWHMEIYHLTTP